MISSQTLDIVIGLATVFLTVSLVCSAINEAISTTLALRATTLKNALDSLLGSDLAQKVLDHPAVPAAAGSTKSPAYIEPTLFATALLDTIITSHADARLVQAQSGPESTPIADSDVSPRFVAAKSAITAPAEGSVHENSDALAALKALLGNAEGDYRALVAQTGSWFDAYMDRVGGVYKRRSQLITVIIAVFVVGILNVDTFKIYRQLTTQAPVAQALATRGLAIAKGPKAPPPASYGAAVDDVAKSIASIPVPIGWHSNDCLTRADNCPKIYPWWQKVVGLIITILAASLGAPFWFDVLNKLSNVRSVGPKPDDASSTS
jgi:hypothetical protein